MSGKLTFKLKPMPSDSCTIAEIGVDMIHRSNIINPVAKAMALSRRRSQVVPNKKKYNRKKEKANANKHQESESEKD